MGGKEREGEEKEEKEGKGVSTAVVLMQSTDRATNSHFAICGAAFCSTLYGFPRPAEVSPAFFTRRHRLSRRPSTPESKLPSLLSSQFSCQRRPVSRLSSEIFEVVHKAENRANAWRRWRVT